MNIIIPMAGEGSRFSNAGYQKPKPFIPIKGKAMIEWVIENTTTSDDKIYLLAKLDHLPHLRDTNLLQLNNVAIIPVMTVTQGALCTALLAEKFIDNNEPITIVNSDQYLKYDRLQWKQKCDESDGCIMVFDSDETKWSYAELDSSGKVIRTKEKDPISRLATCGMYNFKSGEEFVRASKEMIEADDRTNGEFYIVPSYNYYLKRNPNVITMYVDKMFGMGTPQDLEANYDSIGG